MGSHKSYIEEEQMAKRKITKRKTLHRNLHYKMNIKYLIKTGVQSKYSGGVGSSCSTISTRPVTVKQHEQHVFGNQYS